MVKKNNDCPPGQIRRRGYQKDPYVLKEQDITRTREAQEITRETKSGEEITYHVPKLTQTIHVPEQVISPKKVPPACVVDTGAPGKTPPSRQVIPPLEKGGLAQYGLPHFVGASAKDCVKAGVVARKVGAEGYSEFSGKFVAAGNFQKNTNPPLQKSIGRCRKFALVGYNQERVPGGEIGKFTADDFAKAKRLAKEVDSAANKFIKDEKAK